jgi:hypothetical protein
MEQMWLHCNNAMDVCSVVSTNSPSYCIPLTLLPPPAYQTVFGEFYYAFFIYAYFSNQSTKESSVRTK